MVANQPVQIPNGHPLLVLSFISLSIIKIQKGGGEALRPHKEFKRVLRLTKPGLYVTSEKFSYLDYLGIQKRNADFLID